MSNQEEKQRIQADVKMLYYIICDEKILSSLNQRENDILRLRWQNSMTFEQLAEKFYLSKGTIRGIYNRGITRLRRVILYTFKNNETLEDVLKENDGLREENEELQNENASYRKMFDELPKEEKVSKMVSGKLNKLIVDTDLSVRAINCLKAAGIKTLGDLIKLNRNELLKFRNFGRKTLTELEELCKEEGLMLKIK